MLNSSWSAKRLFVFLSLCYDRELMWKEQPFISKTFLREPVEEAASASAHASSDRSGGGWPARGGRWGHRGCPATMSFRQRPLSPEHSLGVDRGHASLSFSLEEMCPGAEEASLLRPHRPIHRGPLGPLIITQQTQQGLL